MTKVTVVIPVYNVEAWFPACLDSVLNQTLKDIEVICIDDVSPDRCGEIMDAYAAKDSRVIPVHLTENHQQGYGRNVGLERAEGKYIYFLDSDDMIEQNALQELYDTAEKDQLDGIFFDSQVIYENEELRKKHSLYKGLREGTYKDEVYKGSDLLDAFNAQHEWTCYVQRQLWNTDFLRRHQLTFPVHTEHEDEWLPFAAILLADRVRYLRKPYFIRRYRENSVMTRPPHPKDFHGYFVNYCMMTDFLRREKIQSAGALDNLSRIYGCINLFWPVFKAQEDPASWFRGTVYEDRYYFYESEKLMADIMKKEEEARWSFLRQYRHVYIYGAGRIGQSLFLRLQSISIPVDGFIVTSAGNNPAEVYHRKVTELDDHVQEKDSVIVVAMAAAYHDEVRELLDRKGFHYYTYATNIVKGPYGSKAE